jgi:hypothetical protein
MKKVLFIITLMTVITTGGYAQYGDMQTEIFNFGGPIVLGDTAIIHLQGINEGSTPYPVNTLALSFAAPMNGKIVGVVPDSPATIFTVVELTTQNSANAITLVNTGGALVGDALPGSIQDIYVYVVGVSVGGPHGFASHIAFNQNPNQGGSFSNTQTQYGDLTPNNDGTTSLTVTTPLPLDFTGIDAVWNSNDAVVNWEVAREMNNEYFSIERSFDGKTFTQAGTIRSIGNHEEAAKYNYIDKGVRGNTIDKVAYRIKQVDNNGKSTTSKIVFLINKGKSNNAYIYPNPVTASKTFSFVYENNDNGSGDLVINILDAHGKLVYTTTMPIVKGKNETGIKVSALAAGAYFLKYENENLNINGTIRLIKD